MAKAPADIRSLCRSYTTEAVRVVAGIMRSEAHPPAVRISAAALLFERGYGKPQQDVLVGGDIRVVIRKMLDDEDGLIDVTPLDPKKLESDD